MANHSDGDPEIANGDDLGRAPSTPRWVIAVAAAFIVLVLAFVIMAASGHGPGDHLSTPFR